jgi:hypothetical protein
MQTARRRRTSWAIGVSITAHVAVLVVLASQRPTLRMALEQAGPPPAIIPILLMPRTPPPTAGKPSPPTPIRLHRRPQRFIPPDAPTAPIAPAAPPAPAAAPARPAPVAMHPAPQPAGPSGDVRTALRQGAPGCANQLAVGLNRAERDLCEEKLGKGAKDAPYLEAGLGMSPGKKALLDAAVAAKEADYRYKHNAGAPPLPSFNTKPGATAEEMRDQLGVPRS